MKRYFIFYLGVALLAVCFNTQPVSAATVSFDPQERTVGIDKPFVIGLLINATSSVNAVSARVHIPRGLTPVDVSTGNSVINYWIEEPHFDQARRILSFQGLIPGGFSGPAARLVVVTFQAEKLGTYSLDFKLPDTHIMLNTPNAAEDGVSSIPLTLIVAQGRDNIENDIPDTDAPEVFVPEIGFFDQEGKYFVAFQAQDKGSGIAHYEVAEQQTKATKYDGLRWITAQSPYVLRDQKLQSYIYVKAVDKKGNARIAAVVPTHPVPWQHAYYGYILGVLVALLIVVLKNFWKKHEPN